MFAKATRNLVSEIDSDGSLISVSCLNDSDKLVPLSLVVKRKRFWFWQRPKYMPSDFTLNDVLIGEPLINPDVAETDFMKYNGTFGENLEGKAEAGFGPGNLSVEGKDSSKLESSFGNLKKQEVNVQKLLRDSKTRVLDVQHTLILQTREKRNEVFGLVKERIVTTQPCTVTETVQEEGSCGGLLGLLAPKTIKVSVKENGKHQSDSNISLEIPAQTVLAYSLIELEVLLNGHYELCLLSDTHGGFEVDGPVKKHSAPVLTPDTLKKEMDGLQDNFELLSALPASTRSSLFQHITGIMQDRPTLSALESAIEALIQGRNLSPTRPEAMSSLQSEIQTVLDLLQGSDGADRTQTNHPSALTAAYLLISAMDELTDATLAVLGTCCRAPVLQAVSLLVQNVADNRESSLKDNHLASFAEEETHRRVQDLFGSSNMTLQKEDHVISTRIDSQPGNQPLILCIVVKGLASLGL